MLYNISTFTAASLSISRAVPLIAGAPTPTVKASAMIIGSRRKAPGNILNIPLHGTRNEREAAFSDPPRRFHPRRARCRKAISVIDLEGNAV